MTALQGLADALAAVLARPVPVLTDHDLITQANEEPELMERLLSVVRELPPTQDILDDIARRQQRLETAKARQARRGLIATLERWQDADRKRLDLATWRDGYMATSRPPGCQPWCLGLGARRISKMVRSDDGSTGFEDRAEYCSCPDGQATRASHEARRRQVETERQQAAVARIWESAAIPADLREYTLESYLARPDSSPELVAKLRRWQAAESAWLLLLGAAGLCKTGLSIALVQEWLAGGASALYIVTPDFLERLRETYDRNGGPNGGAGESAVMASAADVELLLLDDVGKAGLTVWGKEKLFTLVNRRDIHRRRTIVTTNLSLDELEGHLGSPTFDRIRGKACDRATGESFVIELTGESRRGLPG